MDKKILSMDKVFICQILSMDKITLSMGKITLSMDKKVPIKTTDKAHGRSHKLM